MAIGDLPIEALVPQALDQEQSLAAAPSPYQAPITQTPDWQTVVNAGQGLQTPRLYVGSENTISQKAPAQGFKDKVRSALSNFLYSLGQGSAAAMTEQGQRQILQNQQLQHQMATSLAMERLALGQGRSIMGQASMNRAAAAQTAADARTLAAQAAIMKALSPQNADPMKGLFAQYIMASEKGDQAGMGNALDRIKTLTAAKTPPRADTEISLTTKAAGGDQNAQKVLDKLNGARARIRAAGYAALGASRPVQAINPLTGEAQWQFAGNAIGQGAAPAQVGMQVMSKQAQFSEMGTASTNLRNAINNLDRDFTPDQIAKLTLATRHDDPTVFNNAVDTFLGTQQLTEKQQDFVIWMQQLNERALSLRNVAGMGQGAEDLRKAIQATLPSLKSGSQQMALKQLDAFDNQVKLLRQGVPNIRREQPQASAGGRVVVQDRAGKKYTIPASQLPEAKKQGYLAVGR